jgi:hypothetical protein
LSSEKHAISKEFDTLTSDVGFNHCYYCKRVAINLCMVSQSTEAMCSDCKVHRNFDPIHKNLLPVWFSADGQPMYHVPNELSCLQEGEKLLIQMVSPLFPFLHIKNGTLGIKDMFAHFLKEYRIFIQPFPGYQTQQLLSRWLEVSKEKKASLVLNHSLLVR